MAKVNGGLIKQQTTQVAAQPKQSLLQSMISAKSVQERFEKMLGDNSASFLSSVLTVVNDNKLLQNADPRTILASAAIAASLRLPVIPSLGKAYLVPYKGACSFQVGYKGYIALCQRSGQMKSIVMTPVYEGEVKDWNRFTETYVAGEKLSDNVVGYFARFELLNGFAKAAYWTRDEVIRHAKRFSKSYSSSSSPWQSDFDAMACKTVLLSIIRTYAPMSVEMQKAMEADGQISSINEQGDVEVVDVDVENVPNDEESCVSSDSEEVNS